MTGALILTATLRPSQNVYELRLSDWATREQHYLSAAARWARAVGDLPWDRIWLVDNSSEMPQSDWQIFEEKLHDVSLGRVAAWHRPAQNQPSAKPQKGKGEGELIDSAVRGLQLEAVSHMTKVTGRLFVKNAGRSLGAGAYGAISACVSSRLSIADTRFFSMPTVTWEKYFQGMADHVDEPAGVLLENIFARRALLAIAHGVEFRGMPRLPQFVGTSGTMSIDYASRRNQLKLVVHEVARTPFRRRAGVTL